MGMAIQTVHQLEEKCEKVKNCLIGMATQMGHKLSEKSEKVKYHLMGMATQTVPKLSEKSGKVLPPSFTPDMNRSRPLGLSVAPLH
jgi:hypothetical protein